MNNMPIGTTTINELIDPEVMADMISAKLPSKIRITPFATIDTTLEGRPGDEITVPKYEYIGDAEDVAEGVKMGVTKLATSTTKAKVKKAGKAVTLTDEAVLSGYGNPIGETNNQLVMSIASKVDNDGMGELQKTKLVYTGQNIISYKEVVSAIDLFTEEDQSQKIMYVHPNQVTQLRLDPTFRDAHQYPLQTVMTGIIGEIAGCQVIPSKKVPLKSGKYQCPIVKLSSDAETEEETQALTIYLKRDVLIETDRDILAKTTTIAADKHYTVTLSNESKVVLAKFESVAATTAETEEET
jgi:N4-gp56 family major capsid protein